MGEIIVGEGIRSMSTYNARITSCYMDVIANNLSRDDPGQHPKQIDKDQYH
jgi:hypothetical protein